MANQYDISPADPLQTQQDWRQSLAKTAVMESNARQMPGIEQEQKMRLQALMQGHQDDEKFRAEAAKLSPDMPLSDRTSRLATLAFQTGKIGDGEKLLSSAANIANRESQAAMRDQAIALKSAQEMQKKIQVYQSVEQMMGESSTGWEMGNELVKSQTGEDHPLYAMMKKKNQGWSPDAGKALKAGHEKRSVALQDELTQGHINKLKADTNRQARVATSQIAEHEARTAAISERAVSGAKAGAGKIATVSKSDKEAAMRLAREVHGEAAAEHLDRFSDDIASDAKAIQLKEHGSYKEALLKALAQNEPNWKAGEPLKVGGFTLPGGAKSKATYASKKPPGGPPEVGAVVRGFKFKGGDPSKQESWIKAAADTGEE